LIRRLAFTHLTLAQAMVGRRLRAAHRRGPQSSAPSFGIDFGRGVERRAEPGEPSRAEHAWSRSYDHGVTAGQRVRRRRSLDLLVSEHRRTATRALQPSWLEGTPGSKARAHSRSAPECALIGLKTVCWPRSGGYFDQPLSASRRRQFDGRGHPLICRRRDEDRLNTGPGEQDWPVMRSWHEKGRLAS
jgi:hypothetical protein